jgi:hypothetical protein
MALAPYIAAICAINRFQLYMAPAASAMLLIDQSQLLIEKIDTFTRMAPFCPA